MSLVKCPECQKEISSDIIIEQKNCPHCGGNVTAKIVEPKSINAILLVAIVIFILVFSIFSKETGLAKFGMSMFCIIIELWVFNFYYKYKDEESISEYIRINKLSP